VSSLGTRVPRIEDLRFLTIGGVYTEDVSDERLARACRVFFVRSPIAHGRIAAIDVGAALPRSGCRAGLTRHGAIRSSSGGPTTGRSSAWLQRTAGSRWPTWAVPLRAHAAEQALAAGASTAEAAQLAAEDTEPGEDMHANRGYRQHLARVLTRRALEQQH
jgi:CO/xanthine dehydrogenase Mo-binding subunit